MKVKILNETGYCLPNECIGKIVKAKRYEVEGNLIMISGAELARAGHVSNSITTLAFYEGTEVEVV